MRVHFCGVRGSTPAPGADFVRYGGNTSCVALAADGGPPNLLLDAGTGIRRVTSLLAPGTAFRGSILVTHLHWDHTTGIPFFDGGHARGARVRLHVPARTEEAAELWDRLMSPPLFPIRVTEMGDWEVVHMVPGEHEVDGWHIDARPLPHAGAWCLGYRVSNGRHSIAYVTDHGPATVDDHHPDVRALVVGVDVLIHEAQHTLAEWPGLQFQGHSPIDYGIRLGRTLGVPQVVLTHHAPDRTDAEIDTLAEGLPEGVRFAAEGDELIL